MFDDNFIIKKWRVVIRIEASSLRIGIIDRIRERVEVISLKLNIKFNC